jgi:hypothetical protein
MKNERIQEFILQCTETVPFVNEDSGITHHREFFDHEKFAELIVKECATVAYNKQYKHSAAHTRGDCAEAIKKHFGVKE